MKRYRIKRDWLGYKAWTELSVSEYYNGSLYTLGERVYFNIGYILGNPDYFEEIPEAHELDEIRVNPDECVQGAINTISVERFNKLIDYIKSKENGK